MTPALRDEVRAGDVAAVREIVASTGFFNHEEIGVAAWQVEQRLSRGAESGYSFLFSELDGRPIGYVSYGHTSGTQESFDVYWLGVHAAHRRRGAGKLLLSAAEQRIFAAGGRRVYVETSSREQYAPTRLFYEQAGYRLEATLADYYAPGDSKAVYLRHLLPPPPA